MDYKRDYNRNDQDDENDMNDNIPDLSKKEIEHEVVVASFTVKTNSESKCYNSVVHEVDYRNRNVNAIVEKWINQSDAPTIKNNSSKSKVAKRDDYGDASKHLSDLWRYPTTVYQNLTVYPILATHSLLANARSKNAKLNKALEKPPEQHKLSVDVTDNKRTSQEPNKGIKGSRVGGSADVARLKSKLPNKNRSFKGARNKHTPQMGNDLIGMPGRVQEKKKKSDQLRESNDGDNDSKSKSMLKAIRTVDLESNKIKAKPQKLWVKRMRRCITSYRFTCIMFYTVLIAVIIVCISAIAYPILIVLND